MQYQQWERKFRAAAKADGYAIFRDHLRRLELPDSPELLLEGTILAVQATCGYRLMDNLDGEHVDQLLEMQHYNPADSTNAQYAYTFDIFRDTYARVLVESGTNAIDLADLFNHPWDDYKSAGFAYLYISRTDWSELTSEEVRQLEDDVTADLRFGYCEEEVDFWFNQPGGNTYLMMYIYDVLPAIQNDIMEFVGRYHNAIHLNPENARTSPGRGLAYAYLTEYLRTIEDTDVADVLSPHDAIAFTNRGNAYSALGQLERAIEDYDAATLLDPQYAPAYVGRTFTYTCLNIDKKARKEFDRAVDLGYDRAQLEEALSKDRMYYGPRSPL